MSSPAISAFPTWHHAQHGRTIWQPSFFSPGRAFSASHVKIDSLLLKRFDRWTLGSSKSILDKSLLSILCGRCGSDFFNSSTFYTTCFSFGWGVHCAPAVICRYEYNKWMGACSVTEMYPVKAHSCDDRLAVDSEYYCFTCAGKLRFRIADQVDRAEASVPI